MMKNNNVTGKQVLGDCVTLCKHLGQYVVCVATRIARKLKTALSDKDKRDDVGKAEDAPLGEAAT